jgi:hypothetical protein
VSLLTVEQNNDTGDDTTLLLDDTNGFTQSSAGSDDIVDDHDTLALERGTDNVSTLTVGLGLLTVEGVADIVPGVLARERVPHSELVGDSCADGDTLVCGSEDNVEVGLGVALGVSGDKRLGRENASVGSRGGTQQRCSVQKRGGKEVRRLAAGLQGVGAE